MALYLATNRLPDWRLRIWGHFTGKLIIARCQAYQLSPLRAPDVIRDINARAQPRRFGSTNRCSGVSSASDASNGVQRQRHNCAVLPRSAVMVLRQRDFYLWSHTGVQPVRAAGKTIPGCSESWRFSAHLHVYPADRAIPSPANRWRCRCSCASQQSPSC